MKQKSFWVSREFPSSESPFEPWSGILVAPLVMGSSASPYHSLKEFMGAVMDQHVAAEGAALESYRELLRSTDDPVAAFVLRLVLEDEEHHHRLLERITTTQSAERLPEKSPLKGGEASQMAASLRTLASHERKGVSHLRKLARQQAGSSGGLASLLLESMAADSQKHLLMLRFLLQRAQGGPG